MKAELRDNPGRFAFFGHSYGALLAYEVARRLQDGGSRPELVVLSGSRAPSVAPPVVLHRQDDERLVNAIRLMGGTPEARLRDPDFVHRLLPLVRSDLAAAETYRPAGRPRLAGAVSAWAASADWYAPPERVARWRQFASGPFRGRLFTGDHFFIRDSDAVLAALLADLGWATTRATALAGNGSATVTSLSDRRLAA